MPPADGPTWNDRWLAALAIGALATAGAIGAMRAGNATCAMPAHPGIGGAPIAPMSASASPTAPEVAGIAPRLIAGASVLALLGRSWSIGKSARRLAPCAINGGDGGS